MKQIASNQSSAGQMAPEQIKNILPGSEALSKLDRIAPAVSHNLGESTLMKARKAAANQQIGSLVEAKADITQDDQKIHQLPLSNQEEQIKEMQMDVDETDKNQPMKDANRQQPAHPVVFN